MLIEKKNKFLNFFLS